MTTTRAHTIPWTEGNNAVAYRQFEPGVDPNAVLNDGALCFAFRKGELLIGPSNIGDYLPVYDQLKSISHLVLRSNFMGQLDGRPVFAIEVDGSTPDPHPFAFQPLRGTFGALDEGADRLVCDFTGRCERRHDCGKKLVQVIFLPIRIEG